MLENRLAPAGVELVSLADLSFISDSANENSYLPEQQQSLSADGRYVAFVSSATDLVAGLDLPVGTAQVYRHDRLTGENVLVSINSTGDGGGSGDSYGPVISANGMVVAFQSYATDLHPMDTNTESDIFARNLDTGETYLVSINSNGGSSGNNGSYEPVLSANGTVVAFVSSASDLHPSDNNSVDDVFVHNLLTGETLLVSINSSGDGSGDGSSYSPSISADGAVVAFMSDASNLVVTPDNNSSSDVFARNLSTETTYLVSINIDGDGSAGSHSFNPKVSADGTVVAFESYATDLHLLDSSPIADIFARDLAASVTHLVSINSSGTSSGNDSSTAPSINADGTVVAFESYSSDLDPLDNNSYRDVFVRNLATGETHLVSINSSGDGSGDGYSSNPSISANGTVVAFMSDAFNLHPLDNNSTTDVFVRNLFTGETHLASINFLGDNSGDDYSEYPYHSADGSVVAFQSMASNLVQGDYNDSMDVFVFTLVTNHAPVLGNLAPTVPGVNKDPIVNQGVSLADFIGALAISDDDAGALKGIAITGSDNSNGTWEFSRDGGATWDPIVAAPDSSLLLADSSVNCIRFVPNLGYVGPASFTLRAWDQSSGTDGDTVSTLTHGGAAAFSGDEGTTSINVTPVVLSFGGLEGVDSFLLVSNEGTLASAGLNTLLDYTISQASHPLGEELYNLDQFLGLKKYPDADGYRQNIWGGDEKWLYSQSLADTFYPWFFVLPDGSLHHYRGEADPLDGRLEAKLDPLVWEDPRLLHEAAIPTETLTDRLFALDHSLGLMQYPDAAGYRQNTWGGNEKWLLSTALAGHPNPWFFLLPDGSLHRYQGEANPLDGATFAMVGHLAWKDPTLLHEAASTSPPPVPSDLLLSVTAAGDASIGAPENVAGMFQVKMTVSDGVSLLSKVFLVGVANTPSELEPLPGVSVPGGIHQVILDAKGSDPEAPPQVLTFQASQTSCPLPYNLDQSLGLAMYPDAAGYRENIWGGNEKWLYSEALSGTAYPWFFLTPEGTLHHYTGQANPMTARVFATLMPLAWSDPTLLHEAVLPQDPNGMGVTTVVDANGQVTVTNTVGFQGLMIVDATVSDGLYAATQAFVIHWE